jgi:hypothetical protein
MKNEECGMRNAGRRGFLKKLVGLAVAPLVPVPEKSAYTVGVDAMRYVMLVSGTDGRSRMYSYHALADGLSLTVEKLLDGKGVECG